MLLELDVGKGGCDIPSGESCACELCFEDQSSFRLLIRRNRRESGILFMKRLSRKEGVYFLRLVRFAATRTAANARTAIVDVIPDGNSGTGTCDSSR